MQSRPVADSIPQRRAHQNRTITNQDLETYRRSRIENEKAYEERRKELGLPSMEERRREIAEIEDRTVEQVRNMRERQQEVEAAYWRGRATALSTDTAATAAQLDLARRQLNEIPSIYSVGGAFPGFFPFDNVGFGFGFGGGRFRHFPFTGFPSVPQFPPFGLTPVFGPFNRPPFRPRIFIAPRVRPQPFPSRPLNPRRH